MNKKRNSPRRMFFLLYYEYFFKAQIKQTKNKLPWFNILKRIQMAKHNSSKTNFLNKLKNN